MQRRAEEKEAAQASGQTHGEGFHSPKQEDEDTLEEFVRGGTTPNNDDERHYHELYNEFYDEDAEDEGGRSAPRARSEWTKPVQGTVSPLRRLSSHPLDSPRQRVHASVDSREREIVALVAKETARGLASILHGDGSAKVLEGLILDGNDLHDSAALIRTVDSWLAAGHGERGPADRHHLLFNREETSLEAIESFLDGHTWEERYVEVLGLYKQAKHQDSVTEAVLSEKATIALVVTLASTAFKGMTGKVADLQKRVALLHKALLKHKKVGEFYKRDALGGTSSWAGKKAMEIVREHTDEYVWKKYSESQGGFTRALALAPFTAWLDERVMAGVAVYWDEAIAHGRQVAEAKQAREAQAKQAQEPQAKQPWAAKQALPNQLSQKPFQASQKPLQASQKTVQPLLPGSAGKQATGVPSGTYKKAYPAAAPELSPPTKAELDRCARIAKSGQQQCLACEEPYKPGHLFNECKATERQKNARQAHVVANAEFHSKYKEASPECTVLFLQEILRPTHPLELEMTNDLRLEKDRDISPAPYTKPENGFSLDPAEEANQTQEDPAARADQIAGSVVTLNAANRALLGAILMASPNAGSRLLKDPGRHFVGRIELDHADAVSGPIHGPRHGFKAALQPEQEQAILDLLNSNLFKEVFPDNVQRARALAAYPYVVMSAGKIRVVCDFRRANGVTLHQGYTCDHIQQLFYAVLRGGRWLTSVDFTKAFYQVRMEDPDGLQLVLFRGKFYQCQRLTTGSLNSTKILDEAMNVWLHGMLGVTCHKYVDNIAMSADSEDACVERFLEFHHRCVEMNLVYNIKDLAIGRPQILLLGHDLGWLDNRTYGYRKAEKALTCNNSTSGGKRMN